LKTQLNSYIQEKKKKRKKFLPEKYSYTEMEEDSLFENWRLKGEGVFGSSKFLNIPFLFCFFFFSLKKGFFKKKIRKYFKISSSIC